ncbi:hypothetical protein [Chitinophaga sp. RAB17]|uniref:hypothetical protein n=1 Tax=Chitinophaga sp. RAB17 TaxID=3233049 RepID=UPI003F8FC76E
MNAGLLISLSSRLFSFILDYNSKKKIEVYRDRIFFLKKYNGSADEIRDTKELLDEEQFFQDSGIRTNSNRITGFRYIKKEYNIERWSQVKKVQKYIDWTNIRQPKLEFTNKEKKLIKSTEKFVLITTLSFLSLFISFILFYKLPTPNVYAQQLINLIVFPLITLLALLSIGLQRKYIDPFKLAVHILAEKRINKFSRG